MEQAKAELKFITDYNIKSLLYSDADYPRRLRECNDMPFMLYYKGNADLNADKIVGIVGTRNITEYGKEVTKKFVQELAAQDVLVISGLAYGVDITAHNTALESNLKTRSILHSTSPPQKKWWIRVACSQNITARWQCTRASFRRETGS
jgi:DNA processing protein